MPLTRFSAANRMRSVQLLSVFGSSFLLLGAAQAQMASPTSETKSSLESMAQGPAVIQAAETTTPVAETDPAVKRAWTIAPRIALSETFTDNLLLNNAVKRTDQITEISPGIRISGESARLKGYFDYSRREMLYAQDSGRNQGQNALNAFGTFEASENLLYVDFSGVVAQQAISALGVQSPGNSSINANQTETSNFRLSPYLKGKFLGSADYELRYSGSAIRSSAASVSDINQNDLTLQLTGATPFTQLLWSVDGVWQKLDYSLGRQTEATRWRSSLAFRVNSSLRFLAVAGWEENNYLSVNKERHVIHGFGAEWSLTQRTKFTFEREKRFFGDSHNVAFEHRTPRTALRFSDSRDVSVATTSAVAGGSVGNMYDLIYNQFASVEPDPVRRAVLVNEYLQANGIAPNTAATSGFLNSGPTVQRRQDISFALLGVRNTLTLVANQSETQRLGTLVTGTDDLARTTAVRQRGFSISLAHRFSPLTNLNVVGSHQKSSAVSTGSETNTRMLTATLSSKLGAHTTGSVGLRRASVSGVTNPYTENAFVGTLNLQY